MFLAAAQASGPRLVSIFSHSWGSSNLAIPQSAAAVVLWRDKGEAEFVVVCSSTREKQHAEGQQTKLQMQLLCMGFVQSTFAGHAETSIMQEPIEQPAAACAGIDWVHRVKSSCKLQRNYRHCRLACLKSQRPSSHGPLVLLKHVLLGAAVMQLSAIMLLLQQLVVEDGAAHTRLPQSATVP